MKEFVCTVCFQLVSQKELREHLEMHHPGARKLSYEDIRDCYIHKNDVKP